MIERRAEPREGVVIELVAVQVLDVPPGAVSAVNEGVFEDIGSYLKTKRLRAVRLLDPVVHLAPTHVSKTARQGDIRRIFTRFFIFQ